MRVRRWSLSVVSLRQPTGHWFSMPFGHLSLAESGNVIEVCIFSPSNVAFLSSLSIDLENLFVGLMTLGHVKSSQNVCSFGPQRAEKRNI